MNEISSNCHKHQLSAVTRTISLFTALHCILTESYSKEFITSRIYYPKSFFEGPTSRLQIFVNPVIINWCDYLAATVLFYQNLMIMNSIYFTICLTVQICYSHAFGRDSRQLQSFVLDTPFNDFELSLMNVAIKSTNKPDSATHSTTPALSSTTNINHNDTGCTFIHQF